MTVPVQFAVTPNFSYLKFADDAPIAQALYHVLKARGKTDPDNRLLQQIVDQSGASNIGGLRKLTDHEWKQLQVPAMLRVYLKFAVRQSSRSSSAEKSFIESLQDDFNFGVPFDMAIYQNNIKLLEELKISKEDAFESLVITENKGIERALEYVFLKPEERVAIREKAAIRIGKRLPQHLAQVSGAASSNILELRDQVQQEQAKSRRLTSELNAERSALKHNLYTAFIRGITASETITLAAFEQMKQYRKDKDISDAEHQKCLADLGLTPEAFEAMKKFEMKDKRDNECVVCLDKPKDHVIMNCMHLCLCEDCAIDFSRDGANCPLCAKKVRKIVKIYQ